MVAAQGGNKISHLVFADDKILFCNTSLMDWMKVKAILKNYERALGQMVNDQSSLFFSSNTSVAAKEIVHQK